MTAPEHGVKIRMYRHGLGDCFLLAFPGEDGSNRYMMIDCGILLNAPGEEKRMLRVMNDVREATGDRLDVLVVTHEHWDHVSGFQHAKERFTDEKFQVDEIWLAWTEDPDSTQAQELERINERAFRIVQAARLKMNLGADERSHRLADQLGSLNAFLGIGPESQASGLGFSTRTDEAMDLVRTRKGSRVSYHLPGTFLERASIPGFRFYVLGPPTGVELKRSDPRKGEAYGPEAGHQALFLGMGDVLGPDAINEDDAELARPFDRSVGVSLEEARTHDWFAGSYFEAKDETGQGVDWRRIDGSWLESASQLALQLDGAINNTSLVLAMEVVQTGEVLLFPGDAQAGSWRSWGEVVFEIPDGTEKRRVTGTQLLSRTAFYKVGHHGSHNATLRAKGLELMSGDLVAMIPVDRATASRYKGWEMPFGPLYEALVRKTLGRVVRADEAQPTPPAGLTDREQKKWEAFQSRLVCATKEFEAEERAESRPLYWEYTFIPNNVPST